MKNKINDSDPRLTAYALGELSMQEADEMSKLLQADRKLKNEVDSIQEIGELLSTSLGAEPSYKLTPEQRAQVYQSSKGSKLAEVPSGQKVQWLRPLIVIAGAAAVVTISFVTMKNIAARDTGVSDSFAHSETDVYGENPRIQANGSAWIASGSEGGAGGGSGFNISENLAEPEAAESGASDTRAEGAWRLRAEDAMTRVPLTAANHSWGWIQDWAANDGAEALRSELLRVEEIINNFTYNEPADMMVGTVQAGVSLVECPWNSDHQIAIILVKNTASESADVARVEAGVTFSNKVSKYRLLGHQKAGNAAYGKYAPAVTELAAGEGHVAIYELILEAGFDRKADLGEEIISLSVRELAEVGNAVDGLENNASEKSLNVQFSDVNWEFAPRDTQFAIILATWAESMTADVVRKPDLNAMIQKFTAKHSVSDEQDAAFKIIMKSLDK